MTDPVAERKAKHARELVAALRSHLQARARGLAGDHDDLIQQTLADYYAIERPRPKRRSLPDDGVRTALAILRRRVADRYRELSRDQVLQHSVRLDRAAMPDVDDDDIALVLARRRLLRKALQFIARMDERDRHLLMDRIQLLGASPARTPAERKQLSRLRARLRREIERLPLDADDEAEVKS